MGCSSCGGRVTSSAAKYPYEAVMPDGTRVMVSSAAQERIERSKAQERIRAQAKTKGYSVR